VGARRQTAHLKDPRLLDALDGLLEPVKRGDPQSPLKWMCKSTRELSQGLKKLGYAVSHSTVANGCFMRTRLQRAEPISTMVQGKQAVSPRTARAVRASIRPERRAKQFLFPITIFTFDYVLFLTSFVGIATVSNWLGKAALVVVNGHAIAMLFTVGHDACHGSFTPNRTLNAVLGRFALFPSLTPFIAWRYTHNYLHHSFTNWICICRQCSTMRAYSVSDLVDSRLIRKEQSMT
jgi:hypothetical protein